MQTNSNREKMHKVTKWRERRADKKFRPVQKEIDKRAERVYVRSVKENGGIEE